MSWSYNLRGYAFFLFQQVPGRDLTRNIIAFNVRDEGDPYSIGFACASQAGNPTRIECNVVWGHSHSELEVVGCDTTGGGNISVDPLFCDWENGDYRLRANSPCRADGPLGCGLIGALDVGCDAVPVERTTWGRLKARYGVTQN